MRQLSSQDRDVVEDQLRVANARRKLILLCSEAWLTAHWASFISPQFPKQLACPWGSGSAVTVLPTATSAAGLLGWTHYDQSEIGTDILDNMGVPVNNSMGFTPPLGPGTFTFWVQEASTGSVNYAFDLQVAAIPEPSTWAMMLFGFSTIGLMMRRQITRCARIAQMSPERVVAGAAAIVGTSSVDLPG
jgi:hypothetical protein